MSDFYVGYLPTPARHRRTLKVVLPLGLLFLTIIVTGAGLMQRDPGPGVWESGEARSWEGVLVADPFARLVTDEGTYFLVDFAKRGVQERAAPLVGRDVLVSGWLLERDGRRIIELEPHDDALTDQGPGASVAPARSLGAMTLTGEIMDAKCYLGAMKPGDGKAHKACATLCIAGGIPPALVVEASGERVHYIVVSEDGERADDLILEFVAEPVVVIGEVEARGDALFLRTESVRRR